LFWIMFMLFSFRVELVGITGVRAREG
jgi:hypothetical protein